MIFNNYKANIVLVLGKADEKTGEPKITRVTLSNVRKDLTPDEAKQVGEAFRSLIKHDLYDVEIVQFSQVIEP
ncbi:hypothetical protein H9635_18305 [Solibacillus sp. A46]|uniref:DUF1659 domain-containing protein n=1 Tax=Solibacillus faecavium TaxID=2762221 RepID=A0ABR8Y3C2_9BACL|nr:hypothetical protein [Solibacillus faecavium]MBD8038700.1 hypothetical protein [Solibacillus faecavium]